MPLFSRKQQSLQDLEGEIQALIESLDGFKEQGSEEAKKQLSNLRRNAERALSHSRDLISDTYEQVLDKGQRAGQLAKENPYATIGLAIGVAGILAYALFSRGRD